MEACCRPHPLLTQPTFIQLNRTLSPRRFCFLDKSKFFSHPVNTSLKKFLLLTFINWGWQLVRPYVRNANNNYRLRKYGKISRKMWIRSVCGIFLSLLTLAPPSSPSLKIHCAPPHQEWRLTSYLWKLWISIVISTHMICNPPPAPLDPCLFTHLTLLPHLFPLILFIPFSPSYSSTSSSSSPKSRWVWKLGPPSTAARWAYQPTTKNPS